MTPSEEHAWVGRMLARAIATDAPASVIASLADWRRRTREAKWREQAGR